MPIAIDLERIGDETEAIAQNVMRMMLFLSVGVLQAGTPTQHVHAGSSHPTFESEGEQFTEVSIVQGILGLGQQVRSLLEETMKAFAGREAEAAHHLWEEDKMVVRRAMRSVVI